MDTIKVRMQSPTKKRATDGHSYEHRGKRQATTPPRLTRSMLKKLNQNGGPPVELNPGLEMGVRRRGPRTRPPKRAAQDAAVGSRVKRTSTARGRAAEPQLKEPQPVEPRPAEPRLIQQSPKDQERRFSEADIAAASRLAQAAIAAGLTEDTSQAGSPVVEDPASLVHFTKKDLRDILSEVVAEDEIRQMMEPHWLARLEFLTWLERPAADMRRIWGEIHKLAVRWSRDLRNQDNFDAEIPISMLESWRADITIVDNPMEDTNSSEARNESAKTDDEKKGDDGDKKEEPEMEGDEVEAAKEQDDDEQGDEMVLDYDNREVVEALAESVTLAARDMVEWKEAFDKEMKAEPNFRSKHAWAARVSESQRGVEELEEKAWNLDLYKSERVTKSALQAADQLLDELQKFRIGIRMDREAFWDEFDQDGAELLLGKAEIDLFTGEEIEEAVQEDEEKGIVAESKDIHMPDFEAEVEDARVTESEELHGSSTGDDGVSGVSRDPTEQLSGVVNNDNDSNLTTIRPEQPSFEETAQDTFPSVEREEPALPFPSRIADLKSASDVSKAQERSTRSPSETYAGKGVISPRKEEKPTTPPVAKQDQEGQKLGTGEELRSREATPWLPDKKGSQSLSWKWPDDQEEKLKVTSPDPTAAVEEGNESSLGVERDKSSELFSSRSASAEEVSNEDEHTADHTLTTSDLTGVPQDPNFMTSSIQPDGIDGAKIKEEDTADRTLTASGTASLPQDINPVASASRSASPEIIISEVPNKTDSSSSSSNISSLPEDTSSSTSGQSVNGEGVEVENTVDRVSDAPNVPKETSLSQETDPSTAGVRKESTEETGGETENTVEDTTSTSNIATLLEEASLPQDTGCSKIGEQSQIARIIVCMRPSAEEEEEEKADQASTTSLPQDIRPTSSGIQSGSDVGDGSEGEDIVEDSSSTSNIGRLLEEVSLPQDTSSSTSSEQSQSTEIIACYWPEEGAQISTTSLPQDTRPATSGIRSGSDAGVGRGGENTFDDHAATTSDATGLSQGSSAGGDLEAPPGVGIGENPIIVPNVRYIKPQWESLFSPDEPAFSANDFSADEVEDEVEDVGIDDVETDEVDDRETDDVDP